MNDLIKSPKRNYIEQFVERLAKRGRIDEVQHLGELLREQRYISVIVMDSIGLLETHPEKTADPVR